MIKAKYLVHHGPKKRKKRLMEMMRMITKIFITRNAIYLTLRWSSYAPTRRSTMRWFR